jgi:hypothetical protein
MNNNGSIPLNLDGTILSTRGNGIFDAITTDSTTINSSWHTLLNERLIELEKQTELLKLDNKLMRLKMLSMEGKFTLDEVANIRKMLMSEDEASVTLANTIIENA